jgi:hypothetical protein
MKPIIAADRCRLISESKLVQRAVQPVTTSVAGEHPSGPIAAMCRWCESDKKQSCIWITEAGVWFSPVSPILEACGLFSCDFLSPPNKARAKPTLHYLVLKTLEFSNHNGS